MAFFPDNPGKLAPEKQNHCGKTNLDLLEQETVSGSHINWAICKSAPHSREITTPAPITQSFAGWMPFLPPNQQHLLLFQQDQSILNILSSLLITNR